LLIILGLHFFVGVGVFAEKESTFETLLNAEISYQLTKSRPKF
jgi:hypothetical protein